MDIQQPQPAHTFLGQWRISVEGNIGAGKSTALEHLQRQLHEWDPRIRCIPEPVHEWEPVLREFYNDQSRYSFATALRVLHSYANDADAFKGHISERSAYTGKNVFSKLLWDQGLMQDMEWDIYNDYYHMLGWSPDIMFYIDTPPATCYERVQTRGRGCEGAITRTYLQQLGQAHMNAMYLRHPTHCWVITIDGTRTPAHIAGQISNAIMLMHHEGIFTSDPRSSTTNSTLREEISNMVNRS